jgi:hypothetical protein
MKRIYFILFAFALTISAHAQEKEKTPIGGRPDLKGDLFVDFGFNTLNNKATELATTFLRSRTLNLSLQYPVKVFGENSGFTFNPGIGVGTDKLSFRGNKTLFAAANGASDISVLRPISEVYGNDIVVNKNTVALTYLEVPLELRYHFDRRNYDKGGRFGIGPKIGWLVDAHTKIGYTKGESVDRRIKDKQGYGLSQLRYGVQARLGFPGFNVWGYYGLNKVFEANKGPFNTEANHVSFGISVALF